jgi:hypothetical protein
LAKGAIEHAAALWAQLDGFRSRKYHKLMESLKLAQRFGSLPNKAQATYLQ